MQVNSISNFRIYSTWTSQAAKIKNAKSLKEDDNADETTKALEKTLDETAEKAMIGQEPSQIGDAREVSSLPWANLMYRLNLTPTGDYTQDYNATIKRLDELIKYTQNSDKLQEYLNLADEVSYVFVQPHVSSFSKNLNEMSGTEQIAQLNRIMLLNMSAK